MKSSFNVYGTQSKEYENLHTPVWLGFPGTVPVGGGLSASYFITGALYPAGCPVNLTSKVITPLVAMKVTTATSGSSTTYVTTIDPTSYNIVPEVGDYIQVLNASAFGSAGSPVAITAVAANSTDSSLLDITTASDLGASKNGYVALAPTSGGLSVPNGYLYNDIYIGDVNDSVSDNSSFATGAVVQHLENGAILINRTPGAGVAAAMLAAVPGVSQVSN